MKSGRFSASSFAGTSTLTCTPARSRVGEKLAVAGAVTGLAGAPSLMRASDALAHARREDAELVAVLGHGAPRDLHAALLQDVDDRLVGERVLRVLVLHQLLDLVLD